MYTQNAHSLFHNQGQEHTTCKITVQSSSFSKFASKLKRRFKHQMALWRFLGFWRLPKWVQKKQQSKKFFPFPFSFSFFLNLAAVAPQVSPGRPVFMTATVQEARNRSRWPGKVQRTQIPQRPQSSKVKLPVLGSLYSENCSIFPSPYLKCPVWARGPASVLETGVKVLGMAGGSVRSPRSIAGQAAGRGCAPARGREAGWAWDGPRFESGWQSPSGCWCLLPAGQPAAFSSCDGSGRLRRCNRHSRTPPPKPPCRRGWCRSWSLGVLSRTWRLHAEGGKNGVGKKYLEKNWTIKEKVKSLVTWAVLTSTGTFEAHALITLVTFRASTHVCTAHAVAGCALLAGIGITQIQRCLK